MEEIIRTEFVRLFGSAIPYSLLLTRGDVPDWDSLRHVAFLVALEKRCGIRFPASAVPAMKSLKDILDYLNRHRAGGSSSDAL